MQRCADFHAEWMAELIRLTKSHAETPFGCIIVDRRDGTIVATGMNQSSTFRLLHAEMVALQNYSQTSRPEWRHIIVYSTAEPCAMCQSAMLWCGVRQMVYGTSIESLVRLGYKQIDIAASEVVRRSWASDTEIVERVLEADCNALLEQHQRGK